MINYLQPNEQGACLNFYQNCLNNYQQIQQQQQQPIFNYFPIPQNNFYNFQQKQQGFEQDLILEENSLENCEDFDFSISQLNVFGCLNESIDLLDLQSKQIDQENFEEICDDNSTNNGSSNYSSNILEEDFPRQIIFNKINLFSGQGVHLFFPDEECVSQEEIFLYDDEEVIIVQNIYEMSEFQHNQRIIKISPGQEIIVRRALSESYDSEMIIPFSLSLNSIPLSLFGPSKSQDL